MKWSFFWKLYDVLSKTVDYNESIEQIKSLLGSNEVCLMKRVKVFKDLKEEIIEKSLNIKDFFLKSI